MKDLDLGVEKVAFAVTGIFCAACVFLGKTDVAVGTAVGGGLFTLDFTAIRLVVRVLARRGHTLGFSIFVLVVKMLALLAIMAALLVFAKLNIYGLLIGLSLVVIVIIGKGLKEKGKENGAL